MVVCGALCGRMRASVRGVSSSPLLRRERRSVGQAARPFNRQNPSRRGIAFAIRPAQLPASHRTRFDRRKTDKSFLVLFFKKEQALLFEKRSKNFLSASRFALLDALPKGGLVVEVGSWRGDWARQILDVARPRQLISIDCNVASFRRDAVAAELQDGRFVLREGLSWDRLAEHDYASVLRDGAAALPKLRRDGYLVFNDFTVWSIAEFRAYGVQRAVVELALAHDLMITHFAFNDVGYHDVALRRRSAVKP